MSNWTRVTRRNPCPCCGKMDWCGVSEDGKYAVCMRIESDHPTKNGGWAHKLDDSTPLKGRVWVPPASERAFPHILVTGTLDAMLANWQRQQNGQLEPFAATLGVSQDALRLLGCVWAGEHRAFAFPMRNSGGQVVGIRLRNERGDKWAVKGSKQGLFMNLSRMGQIPLSDEPHRATTESGNGAVAKVSERSPSDPSAQTNLPAVPVLAESTRDTDESCLVRQGEARESTENCDRTSDARTSSESSSMADSRGGRQSLLIVEGPTDTAAAIDLGYAVIGRPACVGCEDMISEYVRKSEPLVPVFIIADADLPGQRGAQSLQAKLRKAKIVTLPTKDLRSFVNSGGTREILEGIMSSQP